MGRKPKLQPEEQPVQFTVIFPKPLYDFIAEEAQEQNISRSEIIRQCVLAYALRKDANKNHK